VIGRFYSNDPVGFTGEVDTFNRYSYVANNPYKYTDPDGRHKERGSGMGALVAVVMEAAGLISPEMSQAMINSATGSKGRRRSATARGRASEKRILKKMGLESNTTKVSTSEGNAVPDALTKTMSVEIKDVKRISLTKQLRIETQAAKKDNLTSVLVVTDKNQKISGPAKEAFDVIIKERDL